MVNSQVVQEIIDAFKIDKGVEKIPEPVAVIEVGNKGSRTASVIASAWATNATSTTIYTTPTDRDFYLTFAELHHQGEANAGQSTNLSLTVVINGARIALLGFQNIVNTNSSSRSPVVFIGDNHPIKIDKGTTITLVHTAASSADRTFGSVVGYIDEIR